MSFLDDARMYGRFAWGLPGFFRQRLSLEEARSTIRKRLADRPENFLRLVRRGIFAYPKSPYLPLLQHAGCELPDLERLVNTRGLENTLRLLREAGVYISFEEFKGREPLVRDGKVFPVAARDFDNPYLTRYFECQTGGSTGAGTRIPLDLAHITAQSPNIMLAYDVHGVLRQPLALFYPILPANVGVINILRGSLFGNVPQKWFSPFSSRDLNQALKYRLAGSCIILLGRALGVPIPRPEPLPGDKAIVLAHWIAKSLKTSGACLIRTNVSMGVRVCLAARREQIDFTGATFMGGSEPPTPAKVQEITRTGARFVPNYFFDEAGAVGWGCLDPQDTNDLHFFKDCLALIQYPRLVPGSEITVDSFHYTTLLPSAPKIMLNVESDDYGTIETRPCGCPLEEYGFTEHLRHVRSYRKLTGEGVTLVGSDMVRILEEVLPGRFGGSPLDYQLQEEEGDHGLTRLTLVVSPRVDMPDEAAAVQALLEALGRSSVAGDLAQKTWNQAGTLRVKRMEPVWTSRGKFMPFRLERRPDSSS